MAPLVQFVSSSVNKNSLCNLENLVLFIETQISRRLGCFKEKQGVSFCKDFVVSLTEINTELLSRLELQSLMNRSNVYKTGRLKADSWLGLCD
jgi:hypothetical protein